MVKLELEGRFEPPYLCQGKVGPWNPQILIEVAKECSVTFVFTPEKKDWVQYALCRYPGDDYVRTRAEKDDVIQKSKYMGCRYKTMKSELVPGKYVVVVSRYKRVSSSFKFSLETESEDAITKMELIRDVGRVVFEDKWDEFCSGSKSVRNPQYLIKIKKRCHLNICLKDNNRKNYISLLITQAPSKPNTRKKSLNDQDDIVASSKGAYSTWTGVRPILEPNEHGYLIIPCSAKQIPYTLSIETFHWDECVEICSLLTEKETPITELDCADLISKYTFDPNRPAFLSENIHEELSSLLNKKKSDTSETDILFRDSVFPPTAESSGKGSTKMWLRPRDFLDHPTLFIDGYSIDDAVQGALGNCWLIQAMATLPEKALEGMITPAAYNPLGYYLVKLYWNNEWRYVLVDDYIPLSAKGQTVYGRCRDPNELWVCIVEKAFAKAWGSYHKLTGGITSTGLQYLTGGYASQSKHAKRNASEIFGWIKEYTEHKWVMGANSKGGNGLVGKHAYSILGGYEAGEGVKLVKIRNAWGRGEWKGKWSDHDTEHWTDEIRRKVEYHRAAQNDGVFYMSHTDYHENFWSTTFCKDMTDVYPYSFVVNGDWTKHWAKVSSSGEWTLNPNIRFRVLEPDTKIFVVLSRSATDKGITRMGNALVIRLIKEGSGGKRGMKRMKSSGYFAAWRVKFEYTVKEAGRYFLVPCLAYRKAGEKFKVILRTDKNIEFLSESTFDPSKGGLSIAEVDKEKRKKMRNDIMRRNKGLVKQREEKGRYYSSSVSVEGFWKPCAGRDRFLNPRFLISFEERESESVDVIIKLERTDNKSKKSPMQILLLKEGKGEEGRKERLVSNLSDEKKYFEKKIEGSEVLTKSKRVYAMKVELECEVKGGKDYPLTFCLGSKFAGFMFRLEVKATVPVSMFRQI